MAEAFAAIPAHYDEVDERSRLERGVGALEKARTQEIILRRLPPAPAVVLDVGGTAGAYAGWLAELGYEVHLVDPVEKHVEQARLLPLASVRIGDARNLDVPDHFADAVLLLGPLYHLTDRADRIQALGEARRVLRRGWVFAAAISRWASLLDGLHRGMYDEPVFARILERDSRKGSTETIRTIRFTLRPRFFTGPEELTGELAEAGFGEVETLPVEGPAWMAKDFEARWADAELRAGLLDLLRRVEKEPALFALSFHLLAMGRADSSGIIVASDLRP